MDDAELIQLVREGDQRGLEELRRRYMALLISTSLRAGCDRNEAEDIVEKLWEWFWWYGKDEFVDGEPPLPALLARVCRNKSIDRWRKKQNERSRFVELEGIADLLDESVDIEEMRARIIAFYVVRFQLGDLQQRIIDSRLNQETYESASARLGMSRDRYKYLLNTEIKRLFCDPFRRLISDRDALLLEWEALNQDQRDFIQDQIP